MQTLELLRRDRNYAYWERNQLVRFLSKQYYSHLYIHIEEEEVSFQNVVCVHGPQGKMSWHIHDKDLNIFSHLATTKSDYDGHTSKEKYERLKDITDKL